MTDIGRGRDVRALRQRVETLQGRSARSPIGAWFREVDRVLLLIAMVLIAIGLVAVAAASPASATVAGTASAPGRVGRARSGRIRSCAIVASSTLNGNAVRPEEGVHCVG